MRFCVVFNQFFNIMKRFSIFCLPAVVMAGALLLASCDKDNSTPAPAPAPEPAVDLSAKGTANCYIVSAPGTYSFKTTKGNSSVAVSVAAAEVLWESFGTETKPEVGDIIKSVSYADNRITFTTPATLKNGNALIVAKDESNQISWSWHIWVCEGYDPVAQGQVYNNEAGTMMDRNLGATSATPGEVQALGLMYQWGRKDPFLGSAQIGDRNKWAQSTLPWPAAQKSDETHGTIDFSIKNPTVFIKNNDNNSDWYYSTPETLNHDRWQSVKTIYDPCPTGWRVPDGGTNGIWMKAAGTAFSNLRNDLEKNCVHTSEVYGSATEIWYPVAGKIFNGELVQISTSTTALNYGFCWSCTPYGSGTSSYVFNFNVTAKETTSATNAGSDSRAVAVSVRCCKE